MPLEALGARASGSGAPTTRNHTPCRPTLTRGLPPQRSGMNRIYELTQLLPHRNALVRGSGLPSPARGRGAALRWKGFC